MTIKQFIEKAIEGGWKYDDYCDGGCGDRHIFLDPKIWQAVGKVEGWGEWKSVDGRMDENFRCEECHAEMEMPEWKFKMHSMIDALAEGKSLEEFLATI